MAKRKLDLSISEDIMAAAADSFADNIKMLDISEIMPNKANFYEMSGLELLADDIERQGLKHNLVVAKDVNSDKYWLISGHRRLEAVKFLVNEGRLKSTKVPCYINGEKTEAESKLDLIMLNATQRKYTDSEVMQEFENLRETLKALDEEGTRLKGRLRENIAKILNVSNAQVGKMEYIQKKAVPEIAEAVHSGDMSIALANEVAKLSPEKQREVITEKPSITHDEAKKLVREERKNAPSDEDEDVEDSEDDISEDYDSSDESDDTDEDGEEISEDVPEDTAESNTPRKGCSLTGEETALLAKYIDRIIISLCDEADEAAFEKIREKVKN